MKRIILIFSLLFIIHSLSASDTRVIVNKVKIIDTYRTTNINTYDIYTIIQKYSDEYEVDPDLIVSIGIIESSLSIKVRDSVANCRGMFQISKYVLSDFNGWTGNKYTWEDMNNYEKNCEVACWYVKHLQRKFKKKGIRDISIAYNSGPNAKNINYRYPVQVNNIYNKLLVQENGD